MTQEDYADVIRFIGDHKFCYAILRNKYTDKDEFETIVKMFPITKRFIVNADVTSKKKNSNEHIYFVTATQQDATKHYNCVLIHEEDLPISPKIKGVYKITKNQVTAKLKKKIKENEAKAILENKVEKIIQEETETSFLQKYKRTQGQKKYEDFLQTDYWKMVREIKLQQSENKCQVCGSKSNLNVHHNSYAHHGKEHLHLADLVVLCKDCHSLFHHKLAQEPKSDKTKEN